MSRANLLIAIIIMAVVYPGIAMARTSLINPTSEGGFEAGTPFQPMAGLQWETTRINTT